MKINHMIVGSADVPKSVSFYCDVFGFARVGDDPGMDGGQVIQGKDCDLLVLPFKTEKLPNPAHFAFETQSETEFQNIFRKATEHGLEPRTEPALNSLRGIGSFVRGEKPFQNFYVSDPAGVNVEVMFFTR